MITLNREGGRRRKDAKFGERGKRDVGGDVSDSGVSGVPMRSGDRVGCPERQADGEAGDSAVMGSGPLGS